MRETIAADELTLEDLEVAATVVAAAMPPTPQYVWPLLSDRLGATLWLKHENHTPVGAFKVRGGLTYVDRLRRERPEVLGLLAATRGNHGQSLAYACRRVGLPFCVVVPEGNSAEKNAAMEALGAELVVYGDDFEAARDQALKLAHARGWELAPSFHRDLVAGVATYALELLRAAPDLEVLYAPIGLGSGICGCILARDLLGRSVEIVGVQSEGAPAYARSLAAGRPMILSAARTQADGVAVRAPDPEAFRIIAKGAARIVLVSDEEIADAMAALWTDTHNLAEGAGAAALAGALKERDVLKGRKVAAILSGGNVDLSLFSAWIGARSGRA
jgi:threonine dehydratase